MKTIGALLCLFSITGTALFGALSLAQAQTTPVPIVPTGLRAWYRADTGVTVDGANHLTLWSDLSGNSFHLTRYRQRPLVASAMYGQPAVQFDGAGFLKTGAVVVITAGTADVTVITGVLPAATQNAYSSQVGLSSDTARGYVFGQVGSSTNQYALWFMDGAQGFWYSTPAGGATAGQVQVLTATKNGSTGATYINGVSQGTNTAPATLSIP